MKRPASRWPHALPWLVCLILITGANGCGEDPRSTQPDDMDRSAEVSYVIDGDTIVLVGGERVRYIGIDTPERNECYYSEARNENLRLVGGRTILLDVCEEEPMDTYGRTLAHVYARDLLVNEALLEGGFARTLTIPPCTDKAERYREVEREARAAKRGMWGECY
ncbi:thermonuclease family protein [bacterium]|nr:thermonuclease family protein [candidate division CSSED10-310 bacterium]